jgi:periplasmic protein TonB
MLRTPQEVVEQRTDEAARRSERIDARSRHHVRGGALVARVPAPAAYALSVAVHAAAFLGLARVEALHLGSPERTAVEFVELEPPPPPPPREPALPPAPARRPTRTALAPPPDAPPPPPRAAEAPPPPNAPPPPEAGPPSPSAPVRIGIAMSSATEGGSFPAPVGNTLHGEAPRTAPAPAEVKPYRSEKYVPPTQVTVLPRPIGDCTLPASEYPDEARRLEFEGVVVLVLTVDENANIVEARVVEDPGHGLGPAAAASIRRHCKFEPARRGAEAVATSFRYKVRFELP